ncbi:sigma-54-dependent Fis family transcriptional regulator [Alkaliphilus transvaalensis]|uniref:sigma-54-dependent Fis family transcriptional regulator n=1 Tax=Alkaliphilus transvaalensis TaxID=114628 RepID=UPI00047A7FEA|nr:sigma-54-dependent Fis family transcriptional regulator [Alkaliphilus transvaalensis]
MKPILIIAPHTKIKNDAEKVAKDYDDVAVELALLDHAIEVVGRREKEGVEAIISRGGTARVIKKSVPSIPVIEIKVSPYDLIQAIHESKKYGNNICIIGFDDMIEGIQMIGSILDANLKVYHIKNEEDGEGYIRHLLSTGEKIDALLGGTVAEKIALKYNIPTVSLETSPQAIDQSIQEAREIIRIARKEREKTQQFKAILQCISEGVISIDQDEKITTFNSAAEKMFGIKSREAMGKSIDQLSSNLKLATVVKANSPKLGEVIQIGRTQVLTNQVPILLKSQTVGAVATFQDITKIKEYEEQIRSNLLHKGHVAKYSFSKIIGESKVLMKTIENARKYAKHDSTVLIVGGSGTGKEMFAQSIHLESQRKNMPFVAVNCGAIPESLLESELFGYEEGAFTGAKKAGRTGLFTEAHGGTIFLDEIGEMSIELQSRLLRVIQEREIRPVGSNKVIPIDIRIIAATNKDLLMEIEAGKFRRDLYYRLNILKLRIPSLIERKEDIKLLSQYFINSFSSKLAKKIEIAEDAIAELYRHDWPGNVRELENVIERLVVLNDNIITKQEVEEILEEYVPVPLNSKNHNINQTINSFKNATINYSKNDANNYFNNEDERDSLEEVKQRHIYHILSECKGNQSLAAKRLGISRTHLWRILNDYQRKK